MRPPQSPEASATPFLATCAVTTGAALLRVGPRHHPHLCALLPLGCTGAVALWWGTRTLLGHQQRQQPPPLWPKALPGQ